MSHRYDIGQIIYTSRGATITPIEFNYQEDPLPREAEARFAEACSAAGIAILSSSDSLPEPLTASWSKTAGFYADVVVQRAAAFDLVIAASASVMDTLKSIAENELLRTRRPVLLAPGHLATKLTDPAMIAWNNSPECWRAVSVALPLLQIAKSVKVVTVGHDDDRRQISETELLAYLRCHGISATVQIVKPDVGSVGDVLLKTAASNDCGLMVMGAFSHGRLRKVLRRGITRHILNHSAARPVLMMH